LTTMSLEPAPAPRVGHKICRNYLKGDCRRGTACKFLHIREDPSLPAPPANGGSDTRKFTPKHSNRSSAIQNSSATSHPNTANGVSIDKPSESAHNGTCPGQNNKQKPQGRPCFVWQKTGNCPKGITCRFSHAIEILPPQSRPLAASSVSDANTTHASSGQGQDSSKSSPIPADIGVVIRDATNRRVHDKTGRRRVQKENARLRQQQADDTAHRLIAQELVRRHALEQDALRLRAEQEEARRRAEAEAARILAIQEEARRQAEAEAARRLAEQEEARRRQVEAEKARRKVEQEAARKAQEEEEEAKFVARSKAEAQQTMQKVIFNSIFTFGPGLAVQNVITGFSCCLLKIKNLPPDARDDEIIQLITQQGVELARFQLLHIRPGPSGRKEAHFVIASDLASLLSFGLDEIEFREERIEVETGAYNVAGGMGMSSARDANVLTVSWRMHSVRYVAHFWDRQEAEGVIKRLDKSIFAGRRIQAEFDGQARVHHRMDPEPHAVRISDLPRSVTDDQVLELTGSHRIRRLAGQRMFVPIVEIEPVSKLQSELLVVESLPSTNIERVKHKELDGIATYRIRFASPEIAQQAYDHLNGRIIPGLAMKPLWLRLPEPLMFNLTISREQYNAQKKLWDDLVNGIANKKACNCFVRVEAQVVRIRLGGSVKTAIGALKVRVEALATGEQMEGWHRSFGFSKSPFARRVLLTTGAVIRADWKKQVIRLFGEAEAIKQAKEMIQAELEMLSKQEYTFTLTPTSLSFFIRQGVDTLKELIGEDKVTFQPWSRRLTISGGEEARHHLHRLVDESLNVAAHRGAGKADQQCPICFDDVTSPFRLGCGHIYCGPCIRNCLISAIEGGQFPLLCIGDEMRCSQPIALPTIERFLPVASFTQLLEAAAETYIKQNTSTMKYCETPGCTQIYQATPENEAQALQCPSCFTELCSGCSKEPHQGVSCKDSARNKDWNVDDEWMRAQGIRKCPSCSALMEKNGGCNHMTCSNCRTHICWVCMQTFDAQSVYDHMTAAHGGIYDEANAPAANVNIQEQLEALRQAEERRAQQERQRQQEIEWQQERLRQERLRQDRNTNIYRTADNWYTQFLVEDRAREQEQARLERERAARRMEEVRRIQQELDRQRLERERRQQQERQRQAALRTTQFGYYHTPPPRPTNTDDNGRWCVVM